MDQSRYYLGIYFFSFQSLFLSTIHFSIKADPVLLFLHFFAVAFYSIWALFTHPAPLVKGTGDKIALRRPTLDQYPVLIIRSFAAVSLTPIPLSI